MFMGVHVQGGDFDRHVKSPAKGKFLVYAKRAGHKVAHLPEKTNEVTRTVANYEKYLHNYGPSFTMPTIAARLTPRPRRA